MSETPICMSRAAQNGTAPRLQQHLRQAPRPIARREGEDAA